MADNLPTSCDVVIVGSGFAGSLIANELSKKGLKVVILEAGPDIQPNMNDYMHNFYMARFKVPESPYPPPLDLDPATAPAGRPTSLMTSKSNWNKPDQAYLDQSGPLPFKSTYERLAGGTSHWMGLTPRLVPNDFTMSQYRKDFPDWPIDYKVLLRWYEAAEKELGVSADVADQQFAGLFFSDGYDYQMPRIPPSLFDQRVGEAVAKLTDDQIGFIGMGKSVTPLKVRSLPAARNSQPYRNRRACAGNTSCIPICPIQAKYDPTITLNEARNNGARLVPRAVASKILVENDKISGIEYIKYEKEDGSGAEPPRSITANVYVIAANGIETPRLLLMSAKPGDQRTENGVANSSGMVGCNLMDHPQFLTWGLLPDPVFPYRGPLVTSAIGDLCDGPFRSQRAAFRISLGNEGWSAAVGGSAQFGGDPNVTTLDFINGMNSSNLNKNGSALFGVALAQKLRDLISRQFRIAFAVEQSPDPKNRVALSKTATDKFKLPRPKISYDISDYTKQGIVTAFRMKKLIFDALGVAQDQDFTETADGDPGAFTVTIDGTQRRLAYGGAGHIMGTYRMGKDPTTSVVDSFQLSHNFQNLYLVGSGTFPTVGTANPTLTLSALALRTVDNIVGNPNLRSKG